MFKDQPEWHLYRYPILETAPKFRLILLIQVIRLHYYLYFKDHDLHSTTISTSNLWRAHPAPFLDRQEMTSFFRYLTADHFAALQAYLDGVWAFYEGVLGAERDFRSRTPRSLSHLSRCSVRNALAKNQALPQAINVLELPRVLESYLRLEQ